MWLRSFVWLGWSLFWFVILPTWHDDESLFFSWSYFSYGQILPPTRLPLKFSKSMKFITLKYFESHNFQFLQNLLLRFWMFKVLFWWATSLLQASNNCCWFEKKSSDLSFLFWREITVIASLKNYFAFNVVISTAMRDDLLNFTQKV